MQQTKRTIQAVWKVVKIFIAVQQKYFEGRQSPHILGASPQQLAVAPASV
jgi:hypothetical protein